MVLHPTLGIDAVQLQCPKRQVQHGYADFGRETLSGVSGADAPADFTLSPTQATDMKDCFPDDDL